MSKTLDTHLWLLRARTHMHMTVGRIDTDYKAAHTQTLTLISTTQYMHHKYVVKFSVLKFHVNCEGCWLAVGTQGPLRWNR